MLSTGIFTSGLVSVTGAVAADQAETGRHAFDRPDEPQVRHVSGTGFKPKDKVYITECQATAKGEAGCDILTATPVKITAAGVLPKTKFKVVTGTDRQREVRHRGGEPEKVCGRVRVTPRVATAPSSRSSSPLRRRSSLSDSRVSMGRDLAPWSGE